MKNRRVGLVGIFTLFLLSGASAFAQSAAKPAKQEAPPTVASVYDRQVKSVEGELVPLVEAMPEDKFTFAPTNGEFKGVRTFGAMVKHVAAVNYMISAALLGAKAPDDVNSGDGPASTTGKDDIVKYLKGSFEQAHKAAATLTSANVVGLVQSPFGPNKVPRLGIAVGLVGHCFDHYGHLAEYLRMNGIIPPASRPQ